MGEGIIVVGSEGGRGRACELCRQDGFWMVQ